MQFIIDLCGFEVSLSGKIPRPVLVDDEEPEVAPEDVECFLLPINEYRAYLDMTLRRHESQATRSPLLTLLAAVAGAAQPLDLAVTAASHHALPSVLHDIPVDLFNPGDPAVEAVSLVRIRRHFKLSGPEAYLVTAALLSELPVLACKHRPEREKTFDILRRYNLPSSLDSVYELEHECTLGLPPVDPEKGAHSVPG